MALNLDTRQRAMLQEMGITVWLPTPPEAPPAIPALAETPVAVAPRVPPSTVPAARPSAPPPAPRPAMPAAPLRAPANESTAATGWRLHPARPVYPNAGPDADPVDGGWLILLEHPAGHGLPAVASGPATLDTVLEGDAARLLDNMLRALRLHQHPRVWSAALERDTAQATPSASDCPPLDNGLPAMVQSLRPARILVLGLAAARAVLGRSDALGRLRAEPHQVAGRPAMVTYDPNYLLRAAHAKPAAWADLCRAQAQGAQPR